MQVIWMIIVLDLQAYYRQILLNGRLQFWELIPTSITFKRIKLIGYQFQFTLSVLIKFILGRLCKSCHCQLMRPAWYCKSNALI